MNNSLKNIYKKNKTNYLEIITNNKTFWDIIIIISNNKKQASYYEYELNKRKKNNLFPKNTEVIISSDILGSGSAIIKALSNINIDNKKILVILSGGLSQRLPQYSFIGKAFAPLPKYFNNNSSTIFDEVLINTSYLPSKIKDGVFIACGDVLLLFDSNNIKLSDNNYCFTTKEKITKGINHGVFTCNNKNIVTNLFQKKSKDILNQYKDNNDNINIDTGLLYFKTELIKDLLSIDNNLLISPDVRLNIYYDIIYPLTINSKIDEYLKEPGEIPLNDKLIKTRKLLYNKLSKYNINMIDITPSLFLHLGTNKEIIDILVSKNKNYKSLDFKNNIFSYTDKNYKDTTIINSIVTKTKLESNIYIENSFITNSIIGENSIISNSYLDNVVIPSNIVISTIPVNKSYVTRIYDLNLDKNIWSLELFTSSNNKKDSVIKALDLYNKNKSSKYSLESSNSFINKDKLIKDLEDLSDEIIYNKIIKIIREKANLKEAYNLYLISNHKRKLLNKLLSIDDEFSIRKYYLLTLINKRKYYNDYLKAINDSILITKRNIDIGIYKDKVLVESPIRVNLGGAWSDTPPICLECGGTVLNMALKMNDNLPIKVSIEKTKNKKLIFKSIDFNSSIEIKSLKDLETYPDNDPFFLLKKSILYTEFIKDDLNTFFNKVEGGLLITIDTSFIPVGSGLGISSILLGTILKAIYSFSSIDISDIEICNEVLKLEQIAGIGGGFQDQIGGLTPNIKLIETRPGRNQVFKINNLKLSSKTKSNINNRGLLIDTNQNRNTSPILRNIIDNYIIGDKNILKTINMMKNTAYLMKNALEEDDFREFNRLLNYHLNLSIKLDNRCINDKMEKIFSLLDDLIDSKFICGANGGFVIVFMKENVFKENIDNRLEERFYDKKVKSYLIEIQ